MREKGDGIGDACSGGPIVEENGFPHLVQAGKLAGAAAAELPEADEELYRIVVVAAGEGQLFYDNSSRPCRPGSVFLLAPSLGAEFQWTEGAAEIYCIRFRLPPGMAAGGAERLPFVHGELRTPPIGLIVGLCDKMSERWAANEPLGRLGANAAFHELYYMLLEHEYSETRSGTLDAVRRTKRYIDGHYGEPLTAEWLSAMANLNPKYYITLFGELYGQSPIKYLNSVRIEQAKNKLLGSGASIKQISNEVGFADELYFSKKFKRSTGVSPTFYIKGHHMKIASYNYPITGQLLALQITPLAAALDPDWTKSPDEQSNIRVTFRLHDDSHDREKLWADNEQVLLGSKPDLIIGADYIQEWETSQLKQIADTRIVEWCYSDWRRQLEVIADIVGRASVAERWLHGYERKAALTRAAVRETTRDDAILPFLITETDYIVFGGRNLADTLFCDLGLRSAAAHSDIRSVDPSELAEYDPDRIIVSVGEDAIAQARWRALRQSELWRGLRAVANNRVYRVPLAPWFEYSAFAHQRIIECMPRLFSEF